MGKVIKILLLVCFHCGQCVPPSPTSAVTDMLRAEFATMKNTMKVLSDQWEKWNTLFITSLEPRITSTASTLASIDSNIHNLQERAHVWDTFQLHVSAWNEQLASMDRKIDIISKGQEKVLSLDSKINTILSMEYKLDNTIKILNNLYDSVTNLDATVHTKKSHDTLFSEFATRGVLSSIKMVEKKLDRLLLANQHTVVKTKGADEKPKFTIRCNTPRILEELLHDISSKVDVIFDTISSRDEEDDSDYENEYLDIKDGSGETPEQPSKNKRLRKAIRKVAVPCKQLNQILEGILKRIAGVENTSLVILDKENAHFQQLSDKSKQSTDRQLIEYISRYSTEFAKHFNIILESYFSEQRAHFESTFSRLNKQCCKLQVTSQSTIPRTSPSTTQNYPLESTESVYADGLFEITTARSTLFDSEISNETKASFGSNRVHLPQPTWKPIINQNKSSCEDLDKDDSSGVYIFENNVKVDDAELFFNKRYCEIRSDGLWTVIQRRDNYSLQHNFNVSWDDYKYGFGNLHRDFWIGNDFLYKTSSTYNLVLRIELEDFENHAVWAEYNIFKVSSEGDNYRLTIGSYTGNATDSLSSHDGSFFSTYDKTNDEAPACCPCSISYGGGWWFNRCFESNLNGVYYKRPHENNYFRGIIWEHWLGNYSLKKSVLMVRSKGQVYYESEPANTETIPYYEDP